MQLRDAGRLDLDDPAVAYLPELRNAISPFAAIETVTIRRMLSHESGLASEPTGTDWSVPVYQGEPELTLAQASDIVLTLPPNLQHKYSDNAYQLLGMWSCAEDMARWISFQLRAYRRPPADSPVLAAASLREMHKPRYLADDDWTSAWGISWCGNRRDDVIWIQHSGGLLGFTTTVCFDPREQVGAIVLLNGTGRNVELGPDLASAGRRLARSAPPATGTPAPMPEQYRPLLAMYAGSGLAGGVLRLEWRDGKLAFVDPELAAFRLALEPTSSIDTFVAEQGSYFAGENVIFRRRADGRVPRS